MIIKNNDNPLTKKRIEMVSQLDTLLSSLNVDYRQDNHYFFPRVPPYPRSLGIRNEDNEQLNWSDLSGYKTRIYIHIPYCTRRCTFCPYHLDISKDVPDEYIGALLSHIERIKYYGKLQNSDVSIDFGGGTSSKMSSKQVDTVLNEIIKLGINSIDIINMELHPEIADNINYLEDLKKSGVTRINIGLQSTNEKTQKITSRGHNTESVLRIVEKAKELGFVVNVDVISGGYPSETLEDDKATFDYAFSRLAPDRVTGYQMSIKNGTSEFIRFKNKEKSYPDTKDMLSARALLYQLAMQNNYSYSGGHHFSKTKKTDSARKMNLKNAVIGLGSGAYSFIVDGPSKNGNIWWSPYDTAKYIGQVKNDGSVVDRIVTCTEEDVKSWNTINLLYYGQLTSDKLSGEQKNIIEALEKHDFIEMQKDETFRVSEKGNLIVDLVYASLIPKTLFEKFKKRKQEIDYINFERHDLLFDPDLVLNFQNGILGN